jgi:hypothetical protein
LQWLRSVLGELGFAQPTTTVFEDNAACIAFGKNTVHHGRMKHIDIKWFFIRDLVRENILRFVSVNTKYNCADFFTKVLSRMERTGHIAALDGNPVEPERPQLRSC